MTSSRVFVVGSLNLDLVLPVTRIPGPGETILSGSPQRLCGGKGANQAVAAARSGAQVVMVGCVGADEAGERHLELLGDEGVDVSGVTRTSTPTGMAVIAVDGHGENVIIVAPGANQESKAETVGRHLNDLCAADIVVAQGEIPAEGILAAARKAAAVGARFVLNLAPVAALDLASLAVSILIVNEHEAAQLRPGAGDARQTAAALMSELCCAVVVTLGGAGVVVADSGSVCVVPAYRPVEIVDTTGAGDAFVGSFAAALAEGRSLREAVRWGAASGSLAVAAAGAQGGHLSRSRIVDVIREGHTSSSPRATP